MLKMSFQVITSPAGEEMVVVPKSEFDAILSRVAELDEDEADVAIYDARKAELTEANKLPAEVSMHMLRGDSRIRAIRKYRGLSQVELANHASLAQGFLSDLESGRRKLTDATVESLSKVLDVPADWLKG